VIQVKKSNNIFPADIVRKRLIKTHAITNVHYGKQPKDRTIEELLDAGVFLVDKTSGPTCHQIDSWVREMLQCKKVGHAGTLDPNVTGVLPIGVGRATRGLHVLSKAGKEYVAIMKLHAPVNQKKIRETFDSFVGDIDQLPPVRSAVKRVRRTRHIYYIELLEIDETEVLFKVGCQAGTYIRTLCVDIGKELGCKAHLASLRRTKVGSITESELVTLQDVKDAYVFFTDDGDPDELIKILHPIEILFESMPKIIIRDFAVDAICHGADLALPGVVEVDTQIEKNNNVAILSLKQEIVAFGKAQLSTEEIIQKDKGVCAVVDQVFMKKGTYPSIWKKH